MSDQPEQFIKSVLSDSWEAFKTDAVLYIIALIIVALVGSVSCGILAAPLTVGMNLLIRKRLRGEEAAFGDVFAGMSSLVTSIVVMIIIVIGVIIGSMLLVLPGMLFALLTGFSFHYIAYEDAGIGDCISKSFNLVKDNFVNVLLLVVVIAVINTIGGMVVIGALITAPLSMIAMSVAFERLSGLQ